jgi:hypothetical protein
MQGQSTNLKSLTNADAMPPLKPEHAEGKGHLGDVKSAYQRVLCEVTLMTRFQPFKAVVKNTLSPGGK